MRAEEKGMSAMPEDAGLRRSLRFVVIAWTFGAVWLYITTGAVLTRYAQLLNLTNFGYGLLAALPFAATLIQLPTSYFIERFGHLKKVFILAGIVHRATWLLTALVPWVMPRSLWGTGLLFFVFFSAMLNHVATPVWYAWMGDLVPAGIRGRYFSRRAQLGQVVGLVVTIAIGMVLDRAGANGVDVLRKTISIALAISAVAGMMDFILFIPVRAPAAHKPNPEVRLWAMIREPLRDRNFLRFMGFTATMTFATGYVGQFLWLYVFDVVHLSNTQANTMLVVIPLVVTMISLSVWGKLIDRFGRKPILTICGLTVVAGGLAWVFITRSAWWPGYLVVMIATFAWPGIDLANFNILLGMSESLTGRRHSTAYIAVANVVVAMAGVLSGLFGGAVAQWMGAWRGSFLGWPLTYHGVLFLISGVLRMVALVWLIGLEDKKASGTRETLKYMGETVYSNLQQAVVVPVRFVMRVGIWTYKLNPVRTFPLWRSKWQREKHGSKP